MMRELDTISPVAWPSWCYSGEGREEAEAVGAGVKETTLPSPQHVLGKSRGKRRAHALMSVRRHHESSNGDVNKTPAADEKPDDKKDSIKCERLSPCTNSSAQADNNSNSSRSCTPSSSYPGTPPDGGGHLKQMEQMMMTRNYSDFMRSLAAKYNHANPNDYFSSSRNGFPQTLDPRFSAFKTGATPFVGLMAPIAATAVSPSGQPPSTTSSDLSKNTPKSPADVFSGLNAAFGASSLNTLFPPMIDMSSTQALLNMVRTANAQNQAQLDSYLKGAHVSNLKRNNDSSPLDLSSAAPKKSRKDGMYSVESFLNMPMLEALRTKSSKSAKKSGSATSPAPPRLSPICVSDSRTVCSDRDGQSIAHWTVDEVCLFIGSIDTCAEYEKNFREERIDGSSLPLLTEEHLTNSLGMKLGPALKLRACLARRLGHCSICLHCVHCHVTPPSASTPASASTPLPATSAATSAAAALVPATPTSSAPPPVLIGNRPSSAGN